MASEELQHNITDRETNLHIDDGLICAVDSDKVCVDSAGVEGEL